MVSKIVLVFAFCLVQVSSQCDTFTSAFNVPYDIDYSSCMGNITYTKVNVDSFYNSYYTRVRKIRTKVSKGIQKKVKEILASELCNDFYYATQEEYVYSIFGICSGIVVQPDLQPIWRTNSTLNANQICNWIVSHAPELYGEINHNHVAFEHCDFEAIFDRYFYQNFKECLSYN